jgi:hypothetical protein
VSSFDTAYLRDTLTKIADGHPIRRINELMPWLLARRHDVIEAAPHILWHDQIRSCIDRLARKIGAPPQTLPTYGHSEDAGRPHIEADWKAYHFVVVERGQELERRTTRDLDELFYWVFKGVTFDMACQFELRNRIPNADFRRNSSEGNSIFWKSLITNGRSEGKLTSSRFFLLIPSPTADHAISAEADSLHCLDRTESAIECWCC